MKNLFTFTSYAILLLMAFVPTVSFSQSYNGSSLEGSLNWMPSPQASDLGRFGNIPMSYYTGRANVTVPIHSFNERGVPLDIYLSYDTSGLLMHKLPGWVGPGWTLNAGGCITRVQNGLGDEIQFDYLSSHSYFSSHSFLSKDSIEQLVMDSLSMREVLTGDRFYFTDYSPDLFNFNFMGKTGYFFLGSDGEWKVCSEDNLMVKFRIETQGNYSFPIFTTYPKEVPGNRFQPKSISGFHIYDDEGNKYTFGFTDESIEYSTDFFLSTDLNERIPWVANCWYLTKVEDRFGNTLYELEYHRGKFLAQLNKCTSSQEGYQSNPSGLQFWKTDPNKLTGTLTVPVYLSKIRARSGTEMNFLMAPMFLNGKTGKKLYPSLYDANGEFIPILPIAEYSQYQFYYLQKANTENKRFWATNTYNIHDPLACTSLSRLASISIKEDSLMSSKSFTFQYDTLGRVHLSGMEIASGSSSCIGKYTFKYHDYGDVPSDYLTQRFDHWGYFNTVIPSSQSQWPYTIIEEGTSIYLDPDAENYPPDMSAAMAVMDELRAPDFESTLKGMLEEIVYPTGGRTKLTYELNDFSYILANNRQMVYLYPGKAGGLRVKTIADYDKPTGNTPVQRRTFTYTLPDSDLSSGQLFRRPQYFWKWRCGADYICTSLSEPVIPLVTSCGYHVGYSYVTETRMDGSTHRYQYSNFSDVKDAQPRVNINPSRNGTPYDRYGDLGFMRGKILSEIIRDDAGDICKSITYTYRQDENTFLQDYCYASNVSFVLGRSDAGCFYKIYHHKYDVSKVISLTSAEGGLYIDTLSYVMQDYNDRVEPWGGTPRFRKRIQEKYTGFRDTDNYSKKYSYSYGQEDPCYFRLTSTSTYHNSTLMQKNDIVYSLFNGHYQPAYEISSVTAGGPTDTLVTYQAYTTTGLPRRIVRKGEYPTLLYWNNKDKLLASLTSPYSEMNIVCNEQVYQIPILPAPPTGSPSPLDVLQLSNQSIFNYPQVKANTYVYDSKGRIFATASGFGKTNYYIYDDMGRLAEIRDRNNHVVKSFTYHYSTSTGQ